MSMSVAWTENTSKQFEQFIVGFLLTNPSLYRMFQANGLIRNLGDGVDKIVYLDAKEIDGGRMGMSIHDHNIVTPQWGETTVAFMYLNELIRLSRQDVDKYKRGNWLSGDLIQDTIQMVLPKMLNQVDQFCAWGDSMKGREDLDIIGGTSEFTGIFNSGTAIGAGKGGDDDVTDEGDYLYTVAQMKKAMINAGHNMSQYMLLSDVDTQIQAEVATNHFYSTPAVSEYDRVLQKPYVKDWMVSPNFIDYAGTGYRLAMIAPKQLDPAAIGGKGITNNFELLQGYPFRVMPVNGGEMDIDGYYNWKVSWSGAFIVYKTTSIQRTGTLTITD